MLIETNQLRDVVKSAIPLVEYMGQDLAPCLETSSYTKFMCPFHQDKKTPSLTVYHESNGYYCFGCKAQGDIISWVEFMHGLTYVEALEHLASEFAIDVDKYHREPTPAELAMFRYFTIMKLAGDYFSAELIKNAAAYNHLIDVRGIDLDTINAFGIGWCSNEAGLMEHLRNNDVSYDEAIQLELVIPGSTQDNIPERFREVLVYPHYATAQGISGDFIVDFQITRIGVDDWKYKGFSNKHPLRKYNNFLYGSHIARRNLLKTGHQLIGVEGVHDVLMAHSRGIKNVVGLRGTSIRQEHLDEMTKLKVREFIWCPDGDKGGLESAANLVESMRKLTFPPLVRIAHMVEDDPDSFIKDNGPDIFMGLIESATHPVEFFIDAYLTDEPIETITNKLEFLAKVGEQVAVFGGLELELAIGLLATKLDIEALLIKDWLSENVTSDDAHLRATGLEKQVITAMMIDKKAAAKAILDLREDDFYLNRHIEIFNIIVKKYRTESPIAKDAISEHFDRIEQSGVADYVRSLADDYEVDIESAIEKLIDLSSRRKAKISSERLTAAATDLSTELIDIVVQHKLEMTNVGMIDRFSGSSNPLDQADEAFEVLLERQHMGKDIVGVSLGENWPKLTRILQGIEKGQLFYVAAPFGVGKTAFAVDVCKNMAVLAPAEEQVGVSFISGEMPPRELIYRMWAQHAGVPLTPLRSGQLTVEQMDKVKAVRDIYAQGKLRILRPREMTITSWLSLIDKEYYENGCEYFWIDYMQLLVPERLRDTTQGWEVLKRATAILKNRAEKRDCEISITLIQQLKPPENDQDAMKQSTYKLAGAKGMGADADKQIALKKIPDSIVKKRGLQFGNVIITIDKHRYGKMGDTLRVLYDNGEYDMPGTLQFEEIDSLVVETSTSDSEITNEVTDPLIIDAMIPGSQEGG